MLTFSVGCFSELGVFPPLHYQPESNILTFKRLLDNAIDSNTKFWQSHEANRHSSGVVLCDAMYRELPIIYAVLKTGCVIARVKGAESIAMVSTKADSDSMKFVRSICPATSGGWLDLGRAFFLNIIPVIGITLTTRNKADLLSISIEGVVVGHHLYDHMLRVFGQASIFRLSLVQRFRLFFEVLHGFHFANLIHKNDVRAVVLGDNVYRYGVYFELAKQQQIETYSPLTLNTYSLTKYMHKQDYSVHCRTPENETLGRLPAIELLESSVRSYFERRFSGKIEQHDIMRAFSGVESHDSDGRADIVIGERKKPLVAVMAHIFSDAPHAFPFTLYSDYEEWLIGTVMALSENSDVEFLVKEHPAADLYGERGMLAAILSRLNLSNNISPSEITTSTVIQEFDFVVTCGGTIGQEFAYVGKRPVLAARPLYAGFGFTVEPKTINEYEAFLRNGIQNVAPLNKDEQKAVTKVLYHDFLLMDNSSRQFEIGTQRHYLGRQYDMTQFLNDILAYNETLLEEQEIYVALQAFVKSDRKHLLNWEERSIS